MIKHTIGLCIAAVFGVASLAACSSKPPPDEGQLSLACETVECECRAPQTGLFEKTETAEIVWSPRGPASCPDGFTLYRIKKDFLGRPE